MNDVDRNYLFGLGYSKRDIDRIEMEEANARADLLGELSGDDD